MPNRYTYTFRCPVCEKRFAYDEPGEPCCTGPSESRNEHELTVMHLLSVKKVEVHPAFAEQRAMGQLILPHMQDEVEKEIRLLRC